VRNMTGWCIIGIANLRSRIASYFDAIFAWADPVARLRAARCRAHHQRRARLDALGRAAPGPARSGNENASRAANEGPCKQPSQASRVRIPRPKASEFMWLDVDALLARHLIVSGERRAGTIGWRDPFTCELINSNRGRDYRCSVDYVADLQSPETGSLCLHYAFYDRRTGKPRPVPVQEIGIAYRKGVSWFVDGRRRRKRLCLGPGGRCFASAEAYGVRYSRPKPPARDQRREADHQAQAAAKAQPGCGPSVATTEPTVDAAAHVRAAATPGGSGVNMSAQSKARPHDGEMHPHAGTAAFRSHEPSNAEPSHARRSWVMALFNAVKNKLRSTRRREGTSAIGADVRRSYYRGRAPVRAKVARLWRLSKAYADTIWQTLLIAPARLLVSPLRRATAKLLACWRAR
jgi:hypothetical protein